MNAIHFMSCHPIPFICANELISFVIITFIVHDHHHHPSHIKILRADAGTADIEA